MKAKDLSLEQQAEITQFLEWAEENDAHLGLDIEMSEIARQIGWSPVTLERVIRKVIRKTPDLGISVAVKRGRNRKVIVTWDRGHLQDPDLMDEVTQMSSDERRENLMRMVKSATTLIVTFQNVKPKTRAEARRMRREQNLLVNFLVNLHGVAEREETMFEFVSLTEDALALTGFRFDDEVAA